MQPPQQKATTLIPADRKEAKKYWRKRKEEWEAWGNAFLEKVRGIEDLALQRAVGGLVDCVASGGGHVAVQQFKGNHIAFVGFILDADAYEALSIGIVRCAHAQHDLEPDEELIVDAPGLMLAADRWVKENLLATNVIQVAYVFGPLHDITGREPTEPGTPGLGTLRPPSPDIKPLDVFASDHIVYDVTRGRIVGVRMGSGGIYQPSDLV